MMQASIADHMPAEAPASRSHMGLAIVICASLSVAIWAAVAACICGLAGWI